jgi:hypothetical protein
MKPFLLASLALCSWLPAQEIVSTTNMDANGFQSSGTHVGIGYRSSDNVWTNEAAAQEFFPEVGGTLSSITATVDPTYGGEPLQVSIYTSRLGFPGVHLGTVTVPESDISKWSGDSSWQLNTFDLSGLEIALDPNQSYVVVFRTDTALLSSRYRAIRTLVNASSYGKTALISPDGTTWNAAPFADELGLIVRVRETPPPPPVEVAIDVVPGSDANEVNLKSKKPKPLYVAVFGAADFDALAVLPETIELGDPLLTDPELGTGQKVAPASTEIADVDADGAPDLLLTFDLLELQAFGAIDSSSTSLAFQALLDNQGIVFGSDAVTISGGGNKGNGKGRK